MMSRMQLAALALAAAAPALHPAFHYERPVQLASAAAPETCMVVPVDLLAHAAPRLEDLRVIAGDREVAYQIRTSSDVAEDVGRPEQILNLGERNGAISFDVQMTEPLYSRVLLKMARSHFSVLVHVSGIDRPGEAGIAFPEIAYSSDTPEDEPQVKLIMLPVSNFRYLHFEIQTLALEPVRPQDIAGVDVLTESTEPPRYMQVALANAPQQRPHETVYEFAVPANAPVERLTFASDDPSAVFSRTADLEQYPSHSSPSAQTTSSEGDVGRPEAPVQSEAIALTRSLDAKRPAVPAALTGNNTVDLAGLGALSYASIVSLTIHNGDDVPLALHGVALQMRERQICFLRKPSTSYVLRYGDASLGAPQYDLSPIEAAAANASVSTLGGERALTPEAASQRPFTERHPVLLWVALILVVGTLGVVALRSARGGTGNRE
jgi:hypothetical protein